VGWLGQVLTGRFLFSGFLRGFGAFPLLIAAVVELLVGGGFLHPLIMSQIRIPFVAHEYNPAVARRNSPEILKALVDSLRSDPFYVAITKNFGDDEVRRREALARYFDYSMSEGERRGRLVVWPDPSLGAAVWLLPAAPSVSDAESDVKAAFLKEVMGAHGGENYHRIIDFMRPRAAAVTDESAWYLSIVGVAPPAQGQGIGGRLIEPTLAEADEAGADCYLETFDSRNQRFYQRLGFSAVRSHVEPVTESAYTIMSRSPKPRSRG
jgi:GNAT superfamily N-acetyltransferase